MTVKRDPIEDLYARVKSLQAQIDRIRNNATPTVPLYDPAQFPIDAVEGQIALGTDDKAYKYLNGAWTQLSSGGIQFDTYPQAGGDLYVETAANGASFPEWYGTDLTTRYPGISVPDFDSSLGTLFVVGGGAQFMVYTEGGEIDLYADPSDSGVIRFNSWQWFVESNFIQIDATQDITIGTSSVSGSTPGITMTAVQNISVAADNIFAAAGGTGTSHDTRFNLDSSGSQIVITDSASTIKFARQINPNPLKVLFRIDSDGSIHGLASVGAITWDLT